MNKVKILSLLAIFIILGCEDEQKVYSISEVPSVFTKKVLIEEFTGAWCGYCPDGAFRLENLIISNAENIIGVSTHSGDAMEVSQTSFLESTYQNIGYPSGMVDRISYNGYVTLSRGYWEYISSIQLSKIASCGLAIKSNVNGNTATVEVHAGFSSSHSGDHRLTVYLIEDEVSGEGNGYDQMNFYDTDSYSPFFNLGNPIIGYVHNHTLRAVLSQPLGDLINSTELVIGGEHISTFNVDISSYDHNNLSVVAFINFVGDTYLDHEVLNVQKCSIDGFQDWD